LQADGKLLVAGWAKESNGPHKPLVCRFRTDGSRDDSFGDEATPGCRLIAGPTASFAYNVFVQDDGRIVLGATQTQIGALLLRLNADGSDDTEFGDGGRITLPAPLMSSGFLDVNQMPDGDLIAVGYTNVAEEQSNDVLLFRVEREDGSPDESFGPGGIKVFNIDVGLSANRRSDVATNVHLLAGGSLLVTGTSRTGETPSDPNLSYRPFALKLLPNGDLDLNFGGGIRVYGPCPTFLFECSVEAFDSAVLPDGPFVIAGEYRYVGSEASDFFAMRLLPDGSPDNSFGPNNIGQEATALVNFALVEPQLSRDNAQAVALDGERVLVAGWATVPPAGNNPGPTADFAIARLDHGLATNHVVTPDPGFGGALSPADAQQVLDSDHVDFAIQPQPGYQLASIEGCGGAVYGNVYTTAAIVGDCSVVATFELKPLPLFADGFEP